MKFPKCKSKAFQISNFWKRASKFYTVLFIDQHLVRLNYIANCEDHIKRLYTKENLELYWSNKGRSSCESDHRLSIRYRVVKKGNKPIYGYVYKEGEPLQKVKLNIPNINKQKVYCKCN